MRRCFVWTLPGSNQRPSDYESDALTDWAKGPGQLAVTSLQLTLQSTDQLPTDNWKLKTANCFFQVGKIKTNRSAWKKYF